MSLTHNPLVLEQLHLAALRMVFYVYHSSVPEEEARLQGYEKGDTALLAGLSCT